MTEKKCCDCSPLNNFTSCDEQSEVSSDDVEIISNANSILPTDEIIIIRKNCKGMRVYQASLNDLSPETALFILSKAIQAMPQEDVGDGYTLWNDDGFIRVSGGVESQGRISAKALSLTLMELYKKLPKQNPNDGSPWNNSGFIMQGSNVKGNENGSD